MADKQKILLGRIIKIHGYQGGVVLRTDNSFKGSIPEKEWVFIEYEGKPVPFFIEAAEKAGAGLARLWFEGYDTAGKITPVIGCNLLINPRKTRGRVTEGPAGLDGYRIIDATNSYIGTIAEVIVNPAQLMLRVISGDDREILIPLHEDLILDVNHSERTIIMDLPEGLTDLNRP